MFSRIVCELLLIDDCFNSTLLEQRDNTIAAVPDAIFCAPDFVRLDLSAARQENQRFASEFLAQAWSTGRDRRGGRVRVCGGNALRGGLRWFGW